MRIFFLGGLLVTACCSAPSTSAEGLFDANRLHLPAKGLTVDLESGDVTLKGVSGQCLETIASAGPNKLIVSKAPGDDVPSISINGRVRSWLDQASGRARLGGIRLGRDGSLVYLRTWKTGGKHTELLQDGTVVRSWPRGISIKLLRLTGRDVFLLENAPKSSARLVKIGRDTDGRILAEGETVVDFGNCRPDRVRIDKTDVWADMDCSDGRGKGIYKISLKTGEISSPILANPSAEFLSLPKGAVNGDGKTFAVVSGTPAAMHFYHAATGLLLSQTGEVRACSSDAEGLQSWNQSYRVRALATLFAKTGVPAFAKLAQKSMRLTLAAQDAAHGREGPENPSCGWSSLIYGGNDGERLSLMINQAMIANSLRAACRDLGPNCPSNLRNRTETGAMCLVQEFENQFDSQLGLYRIRKDVGFRFAGAVAPWNWQMSFAALLNSMPDERYRQRGEDIAKRFLMEWQSNDGGALWRYWPHAYYAEKALTGDEILRQRYEDTGHAGIGLLSLAEIPIGHSNALVRSVQTRLDHLLSFGFDTPRDLDGKGPKMPRWLPSGGWANFSSPQYREILSEPVPGRFSAGTIYAFSQLFETAEAFELSLDIFLCAEDCVLAEQHAFGSWQAFLKGNPLFELQEENRSPPQAGNIGNSYNKLKIHFP